MCYTSLSSSSLKNPEQTETRYGMKQNFLSLYTQQNENWTMWNRV